MTVKELSNAINNYNDCLKAFRDNPSNENKTSLENSKRVLIDFSIELNKSNGIGKAQMKRIVKNKIKG